MTLNLSTALNGVMNMLVGVMPGSAYILIAIKPDGTFEASHTLTRRAEAVSILRRLADQLDRS